MVQRTTHAVIVLATKLGYPTPGSGIPAMCLCLTQIMRFRQPLQCGREGPEHGESTGDDSQHASDDARGLKTYAILVVVPRDQFYEVLVQRYTRLGVEDAGVRIAVHIARNDLVLGVAQDSCRENVSGSFFRVKIRQNAPLSSPLAAALTVSLISS